MARRINLGATQLNAARLQSSVHRERAAQLDALLREYVEWLDSPTREHGWITPSSDWETRVRNALLGDK